MVINAYKTDGKYAATQLPSYPLSAMLKAKLAAYLAANRIAPGDHLFPKYAARGFSANSRPLALA